MYYADLSGMGPTYPVYRDIFMFQCLIGCRVSDLNRLTKANIVDGFVGPPPAARYRRCTDGHSATEGTSPDSDAPSGRSIQKPYDSTVDYNKDLIERFNHGELMNADSIHFPDSLKVQTKKLGRRAPKPMVAARRFW